MKKLLLSFLVATPFLVQAQVSNPEQVTTRTNLDKTGWTAAVDAFSTYDASSPTTAAQLIDGIRDNTSFWEVYGQGTTHWAAIDMGSTQNINGITLTNRTVQPGRLPKKFVVFTSIDSTIGWTKQGDTLDYSTNTTANINVEFTSTVNCRYVKIVSVEQETINMVEFDIYTSVVTIPDPNAYDRSGWTVTASSNAGGDVPQNLIDGDMSTKWQSDWGTPKPYPHILTFDMGTIQPVNQIVYNTWKSGNFNSAADSGTIAFSTDGTTWESEIPMKYDHSNGIRDTFSIPGGTQNARYFRLTIVQNHYVSVNGAGTTGTYLATSLTEVWADYNQTLPVTFASPLAAKSTGKAINLSWATATEINTSHFIVKRSTDGIHFSTIGQVSAAGEAHVYSFVDNTPLVGINYYLLVQVDKDGNSTKSVIVSANLNLGAVSGLLLNIGKVIGNTVNLSINSTSVSNAVIDVFNLLGQKVANQAVQLTVGTNHVQLIPFTRLVSAQYLL